MTHNDIWTRRHALDKTRREHIREVMKDYDILHYVAVRELQEQCEALGHKWKFTNLGPLGDPWFHCSSCGKSRVDIQHSERQSDNTATE